MAISGRGLAILAAGFALAAVSAAAQPGQAVSAQLLQLHDDLRLSQIQEGAWSVYAAAIAPSPQAIARHKSAQELLPLAPTPRRIALIEATSAQDTADFHAQGQAVVAFYNQLTADQQRTFDRETTPSTPPPGSAPRP